MSSTAEKRVVVMALLGTVVVFLLDIPTIEVSSSRILPLIIGSATLVLLVVQAIAEFRAPLTEQSTGTDRAVRRISNVTRESGVWLWLILTVACIYLLSFVVTVPVSIIAISRLYFRRSWRESLLLALFIWVVMMLVFGLWLEMPLGRGILLNSHLDLASMRNGLDSRCPAAISKVGVWDKAIARSFQVKCNRTL